MTIHEGKCLEHCPGIGEKHDETSRMSHVLLNNSGESWWYVGEFEPAGLHRRRVAKQVYFQEAFATWQASQWTNSQKPTDPNHTRG